MPIKSLSRKIRTLSWKEVAVLFKQTFLDFLSEKSLFHGAALSYYTIFALVPILYLSIVSFGKFIGQKTMVQIISKVLTEQVGVKDVKGIIEFLNEIDFEKSNPILQIVGIVVLLVTSTAMLASLKFSINDFFDIEKVHESKKKMILANLAEKGIHSLLLMVFGLIIIVTYFAQILIISMGEKLFSNAHELYSLFIFVTQHFTPLFTNGLIFYFVFRFLSDGEIVSKLAIAGAMVTSVLLYLGQLLIKYYITHYFFAKDAGIAGTLLILLTWVYYTSQIIFFGAKFICVYARISGNPIQVKS
ncbi:MAG: YihY/virulence factor BrkB family protein [Crocinitomicaceae bacterium]|jgi:membrane protein|nr:YihY/virulence factor BrkB family protein [Crocinitomicaceae bacterium]